MSFSVPVAESKHDHISNLLLLCPLIFGLACALALPLNTESHLLPRSCIPPTSLFITGCFHKVFMFSLPSLAIKWAPSRASTPPGPPSRGVVESPSKAAVAVGTPCWQRAPPGFMQRAITQTLLVCVWLRSSSDNIATNYNFALSLTSPWTSFLSSLWIELAAVKYILRVCREGLFIECHEVFWYPQKHGVI